MKTLRLTRVGEHMDGNLYKDENGLYYVDQYQSPTPDTPSVVYKLSPATEPDGEPGWPITCKIEILNPFTEKEKRMRWFRHDYMMLSRMQQDCKYYKSKEHFNRAHASTWEQHIDAMKKLWQKFPEDLKPEWCTWEQILEYEKSMPS